MTSWAAFWLFMTCAMYCGARVTRDDKAHAHEKSMELLRRENR